MSYWTNLTDFGHSILFYGWIALALATLIINKLISRLQHGMLVEQRQFAELSLRLKHLKNSAVNGILTPEAAAEARQITNQMLASQSRLTELCSKNIQCFDMQTPLNGAPRKSLSTIHRERNGSLNKSLPGATPVNRPDAFQTVLTDITGNQELNSHNRSKNQQFSHAPDSGPLRSILKPRTIVANGRLENFKERTDGTYSGSDGRLRAATEASNRGQLSSTGPPISEKLVTPIDISPKIPVAPVIPVSRYSKDRTNSTPIPLYSTSKDKTGGTPNFLQELLTAVPKTPAFNSQEESGSEAGRQKRFAFKNTGIVIPEPKNLKLLYSEIPEKSEEKLLKSGKNSNGHVPANKSGDNFNSETVTRSYSNPDENYIVNNSLKTPDKPTPKVKIFSKNRSNLQYSSAETPKPDLTPIAPLKEDHLPPLLEEESNLNGTSNEAKPSSISPSSIKTQPFQTTRSGYNLASVRSNGSVDAYQHTDPYSTGKRDPILAASQQRILDSVKKNRQDYTQNITFPGSVIENNISNSEPRPSVPCNSSNIQLKIGDKPANSAKNPSAAMNSYDLPPKPILKKFSPSEISNDNFSNSHLQNTPTEFISFTEITGTVNGGSQMKIPAKTSAKITLVSPKSHNPINLNWNSRNVIPTSEKPLQKQSNEISSDKYSAPVSQSPSDSNSDPPQIDAIPKKVITSTTIKLHSPRTDLFSSWTPSAELNARKFAVNPELISTSSHSEDDRVSPPEIPKSQPPALTNPPWKSESGFQPRFTVLGTKPAEIAQMPATSFHPDHNLLKSEIPAKIQIAKNSSDINSDVFSNPDYTKRYSLLPPKLATPEISLTEFLPRPISLDKILTVDTSTNDDVPFSSSPSDSSQSTTSNPSSMSTPSSYSSNSRPSPAQLKSISPLVENNSKSSPSTSKFPVHIANSGTKKYPTFNGPINEKKSSNSSIPQSNPINDNNSTNRSNVELANHKPSSAETSPSGVPDLSPRSNNLASWHPSGGLAGQSSIDLPDSAHKPTSSQNWDPTKLIDYIYRIDYNPPKEPVKKPRFVTMEGRLEHLPLGVRGAIMDSMWRTHYFKTHDGKLSWFSENHSGGHPTGEIRLSGVAVDAKPDKDTIFLHGGKDNCVFKLRCPKPQLDKWRQSLLSHAASGVPETYVRPVHPPSKSDQPIIVIELGSCSIRAGYLTEQPSLPQLFFPAAACALANGQTITGKSTYQAVSHHDGHFIQPITATQPGLNRYSMDLPVVADIFRGIFKELESDPKRNNVLLSIPQNSPPNLIADLSRILLNDIGVKGIAVAKQPTLVLYAYDVTTGVVVDIGDRLNIVPVVDGYVVQNGMVSLPYGGSKISETLRSRLSDSNPGMYNFTSPVEKLIIRYITEESCYMAQDFEMEMAEYAIDPRAKQQHCDLSSFEPLPNMTTRFTVDSGRFTCTEGLINPKIWGLDFQGLHKLIYNAVQASPIDSRRNLYRNIYLAGGATLIPGLAERLEEELAKCVAPSIQVQIHRSPHRYHAAYLGAQVLAGSPQLEQQMITADKLNKFVTQLFTSPI